MRSFVTFAIFLLSVASHVASTPIPKNHDGQDVEDVYPGPKAPIIAIPNIDQILHIPAHADERRKHRHGMGAGNGDANSD
ncbi:hypothetical protein FRB99_008989 [Tulasnella sp. 403]|nr:hypothetical protein FRB99_008989 [Tulasnella sp. 403]